MTASAQATKQAHFYVLLPADAEIGPGIKSKHFGRQCMVLKDRKDTERQRKCGKECGVGWEVTMNEGLSLAGGWGWYVLHCCCSIGGSHCGLPYFLTVGGHNQVPLLIGADPHCISHTQPVHLQPTTALQNPKQPFRTKSSLSEPKTALQ